MNREVASEEGEVAMAGARKASSGEDTSGLRIELPMPVSFISSPFCD